LNVENGKGVDALVVGVGLKPGLYLVSVENAIRVVTEKIIKHE
jgi:hypothetical protein